MYFSKHMPLYLKNNFFSKIKIYLTLRSLLFFYTSGRRTLKTVKILVFFFFFLFVFFLAKTEHFLNILKVRSIS